MKSQIQTSVVHIITYTSTRNIIIAINLDRNPMYCSYHFYGNFLSCWYATGMVDTGKTTLAYYFEDLKILRRERMQKPPWISEEDRTG